MENPRKDNIPLELENECMEQKLKEDQVIVGTMIVKKVDWKWQKKLENIEESLGFCTIMLTMECELKCVQILISNSHVYEEHDL